MNHSCEPNVAFDLSSEDPAEWHVRALKRIEADKDGKRGTGWLDRSTCPGTADNASVVTFFYPSTEWEMDQAFECRCGTPVRDTGAVPVDVHELTGRSMQSCLKVIRGAKHLSLGELELRGYVSPWIRQLIRTEHTGRLGRAEGEEGHEGN